MTAFESRMASPRDMPNTNYYYFHYHDYILFHPFSNETHSSSPLPLSREPCEVS